MRSCLLERIVTGSCGSHVVAFVSRSHLAATREVRHTTGRPQSYALGEAPCQVFRAGKEKFKPILLILVRIHRSGPSTACGRLFLLVIGTACNPAACEASYSHYRSVCNYGMLCWFKLVMMRMKIIPLLKHILRL